MTDAIIINDKFALDMKMGPVFQTTIIPLSGGYEDRNQDWTLALWQYDVELKNRPLSEISAFITFLLGRRGAARSFLVRDPLYNTLTDHTIGTGDGVTTTFQVRQLFNDLINPYYRNWYTILSLTVKKNGIAQTTPGDYSVDNDGLITFTSAPAGGSPADTITVSGSTYVRVRFADDANPVTLPISPDITTPFASAGPFKLLEVPA